MTIGRGNNNDIVISQAKGISRQHAYLTFTDGHWRVFDTKVCLFVDYCFGLDLIAHFFSSYQ